MILAGEFVLVRNQKLLSMDNSDATSRSIAQRLDNITTELQETVMQTRMQSIENIFGKFPRIVHELAEKLNKNINITISGKEVELDKTILESLTDPLTHIIRNSCDHGIEMLADRLKAGKLKQDLLNRISDIFSSSTNLQDIYTELMDIFISRFDTPEKNKKITEINLFDQDENIDENSHNEFMLEPFSAKGTFAEVEERKFITAILDNANALIVVLDRNGHIIRLNKAFERFSGYSLRELYGHFFWEKLLTSKGIFVSTSYEKTQNRIVLTVKDEGIGISDKSLSYIMNPFYTTKLTSGGTGLGLSVSSKIIKEHGGIIEVDSKKDVGTTFNVLIPLKGGAS